jgi:SNF2 family DNA or RNA helicase
MQTKIVNTFKRKPFEKQLEAITLSCDRPNFALFMEQGTGKTKVTIDTANYLYAKGEIDTLIIVAAPNGVHRNWVDVELPQDCNVPYKAVSWQSSLSTSKKQEIVDVFNYKDGLRVISYNVEAINSEKTILNVKRFLDSGKCMFVIDQSACIKSPSAKRTKKLIALSKHKNIKYKRILDGDPVAEGLHEYFTQFQFLDPKILGFQNYTSFKYEHCMIGYNNEIIGYRGASVIMNKIEKYSFRCRAEECLDLPDRIYKRWHFDLNAKEKRLYNEMATARMASIVIDNQERVNYEKLALTKNMRLQQISSGWFSSVSIEEMMLINPDDKEQLKSLSKSLTPISAVPSRFLAFQDLIKEASGKILVFARFVKDIKLLEEFLDDEAVSFHGGISDDDKAAAKVAFMTDPKIRFFIGQPSSAGVGHTLTAAKHIVFYSNGHSLRLRKECEKRVHRAGLKHKVIIWDLIANKTQDIKIIECLIQKKKIADEIMKDPDNFFLEISKDD